MEYCDGCVHLYPTEEDQHRTRSNGMPHICNVHVQRVRHMGCYPHIVRIAGCTDYEVKRSMKDYPPKRITHAEKRIREIKKSHGDNPGQTHTY